MEFKTETGKLVETYKKYLNDDIHELPACRISKHTVNKTVPTIIRGSPERFIEISRIRKCVSTKNLEESLHHVLNLPTYVIKRCVLNK